MTYRVRILNIKDSNVFYKLFLTVNASFKNLLNMYCSTVFELFGYIIKLNVLGLNL